ncbi:hypothetical protein G6F22_021200 [Rhizopus arrhizus]|nr:hypothetical protein G6F22_021200 [Rhizopus arrhizus]
MGTPMTCTCADDGFRAARTGVRRPTRTHSTHPTNTINSPTPHAQRKKPRRKTLHLPPPPAVGGNPKYAALPG